MKDFIEQCKRTESPAQPLSPEFKPDFNRLLHAAIGCATESGELLDALKKFMFYGKTLNTTNVQEEIGDLLWYLAIAMDAMGTTFEAEMERVIRKLRVRYPDKFNIVDANIRDLDAEVKALEKSSLLCRHDVRLGEPCEWCDEEFHARLEAGQ